MEWSLVNFSGPNTEIDDIYCTEIEFVLYCTEIDDLYLPEIEDYIYCPQIDAILSKDR